jgi:hypothetical protein
MLVLSVRSLETLHPPTGNKSSAARSAERLLHWPEAEVPGSADHLVLLYWNAQLDRQGRRPEPIGAAAYRMPLKLVMLFVGLTTPWYCAYPRSMMGPGLCAPTATSIVVATYMRVSEFHRCITSETSQINLRNILEQMPSGAYMRLGIDVRCCPRRWGGLKN